MNEKNEDEKQGLPLPAEPAKKSIKITIAEDSSEPQKVDAEPELERTDEEVAVPENTEVVETEAAINEAEPEAPAEAELVADTEEVLSDNLPANDEHIEAETPPSSEVEDQQQVVAEQDVQQTPEQETSSSDTGPIDTAVDEIVAQESDDLLDIYDKKEQIVAAAIATPNKAKRGVGARIKAGIKYWWSHPKLRYGSIGLAVLAFGILMLVPVTRYGILNTAGVRVVSSMRLVDSQTGLPLENIAVRMQGKEVVSDEDGTIDFSDLKLGSTLIEIDRRGYAQVNRTHVLGWGSNPLGDQPLQATGEQFKFILKDWLSGEIVTEAEATAGEDIAKSNDEGRITLTIGDYSDDTEVSIQAEGYRSEKLRLGDLDRSNELEIKLTVAKKHTFVSNRNGSYDLYKIDADGKNEELLLKATGKEREIPFVVPHESKDIIAYLSSRDGEVNQSNFILEGLYIIDVLSGEQERITRSEQLQIIGWEGDKLVYVAIVEGVSASNPQRSKLFTYDIETKERKEIASANYFNDVKLINGLIYYSVSDYSLPASQVKLFSIKPDMQDLQTVVNTQVWTIARVDYETLVFNTIEAEWYEQKLGQAATKLEQPPARPEGRVYVNAPDDKRAVWVDVRDGKGVLLTYDVESKEEVATLTEAGLSDPLIWLSNSHVIFRVATSDETADYILDVSSGKTQKIADVVGNRSRYFY